MATKLDGELEREIYVHGVDAPVVVTLSSEGLSFRVKDTRMAVKADWVRVTKTCYTPLNVKSFLEGRPYEALQNAATKRNVSKAARESVV
jgi:hypothetical protein